MSSSDTSGGMRADREPLLGHRDEHVSISKRDTITDTVETESHKRNWPSWARLPKFTIIDRRYRFIPLVGCLIILTNEAEFFFKQAATMRAVESLYCIEYYNKHDPDLSRRLGRQIPEQQCKADWIEKQVAQTWSYVMLARMLSAIIATVPLGRLADTEGRWIVLFLHKMTVVVTALWQLLVYLAYPTMPIWSIYIGGIAALFGGNFDLGLAVLFASYTDVISDATQRTSLFFLTTSMQYVAQALAPPIGGLLMNLDGKGGTPLVSMVLGISMGVIAFLLVAFCFPETKDAAARLKPNDIACDVSSTSEAHAPKPQDQDVPSGVVTTTKRVAKAWGKTLQSGLQGLGVANAFALGLSIFLVAVGLKAIDWFGLVQYPVIRLHWSYSKAAGVPALQALITMTLFFLILPSSTSLLSKHLHLSAKAVALTIMSGSLLFLILGCILMGLSSTAALFFIAMVMYTLGAGFSVTAQSYIASCVQKDKLASVLAVVSLAATAGKVGASALWPPLLSAGLRWGTEVGKGLPMFAAAAGFVLAALGVAFVAFNSQERSAADSCQAAD